MICPCCCFPKNRQLFIKNNNLILLSCDSCGFVFADLDLWKSPYQSKDYYNPYLQPVSLYPLIPSQTEFDRIRSILPFVKKGSFLDFGAGLGKTALAAHRFGFNVTALDESEVAINQGRKYHPEIEWITSDSIPEAWGKRSFDVISLFHVLEHIPQPKKIFSSILNHLSNDGYVCIEVPNWGSHLRRLHGENWLYVLDHHVNYFTDKTLTKLMDSLDFVAVKKDYRRTFCVNEKQPWKEPLKKILCYFGFGDVLRMVFKRR